jgi:hypothetical protein
MWFVKLRVLAAIIITIGTDPRGVEAAQPIKLWSFPTGEGGVRLSSPALSSDGKVVYVGSEDFNLYAINTVNGSKNWSFPTNNAVYASSPVINNNGKVVYVGSMDSSLYAIHTVNGTKLWNFTTGSFIESSPTLSSDGKVVYVGSEENSFYAINTVDGTKNWSFPTGGFVQSSPALSSDGKVVYVGSSDKNVYAMNTVDGTKNWSFPTGGFVQSSPALSSDGKVVYVGSSDNNLYAIVDNCYQETCSSHGTCVNSRTGHTCDCTPGFMGKDCSAVDHCYHETCSSHGSCHNTLNAAVNEFGPYQTATTHGSFNNQNNTGFTCDCDAGYTGTTCQNTYCTGQTCYDHGTCANGNSSYSCKCLTGFIGTNCSTVDYCHLGLINITCSDHGSCVNGNSSYSCSCTHGYFGETCAWHVLPPYAYGVIGGILVAVVGCWFLFCRRKPSNTYDSSSYSQIQQQPAHGVGTSTYNEVAESNYENLPASPRPPSGSVASAAAGRARVGTVPWQCRQCNTRAPSSGTEKFCRSCGATI